VIDLGRFDGPVVVIENAASSTNKHVTGRQQNGIQVILSSLL
jgi:hypothetical protein